MTAKMQGTAREMLSKTIQLPNGHKTPQIHLGLYRLSPNETTRTVISALELGYRGFDSAQWYYNEFETASAISSFLQAEQNAGSVLKRSDFFFTTKLRDNSASAARVRASVDKSLSATAERGGLGYVDLFLLHSPLGGRDARLTSWRTLEEYVLSNNHDDDQKKIKSIGVSNFGVSHIEELMASNPRVKPVVNQIEVHPFNTQTEIRRCCEKYGIVVQAYAPLAAGQRFGSKVLSRLAEKYGVSEAQLMLRWSIQHGFVPLPKSTKKERLMANADVGGFEISKEDMNALDGLDEHLVTDWDPTDAP